MPSYRPQRTLKKSVTYSGLGIHTGEEVSITFCPAKEDQGIVFERLDLGEGAFCPASLDQVCDTSRSTAIGKDQVVIYTVEHVLAALKAYSIDNLTIQISSLEPPAGNGGSDAFVKMLERGEVEEQEALKPVFQLKEPVFLTDGEIQIVALPDSAWRISYALSYPDCGPLKSQFHTLAVDARSFKEEIAPCRTFAKYEELIPLMDLGLIKGGSLDNAVVIKDEAVFSKGGLFFPDEMVRHKILDLIGDLSLMELDFKAHILAIKSGHKTNVAFSRLLKEALTKKEAE